MKNGRQDRIAETLTFIAKNSYLSCLYFVYFSVVLGEITHLKA